MSRGVRGMRVLNAIGIQSQIHPLPHSHTQTHISLSTIVYGAMSPSTIVIAMTRAM